MLVDRGEGYQHVRQARAAHDGMGEYPARVRRRIVPDATQVQIILGSLLGDGRIEGSAGDRRMSISEPWHRAGYVWWKYERLAQLADLPPTSRDGLASFSTIAHPLFDEVIEMTRAHITELLTALGRSVCRTDELSHGVTRIGEATAGQLIRE